MQNIDSTQNFDISGPGGASSAPAKELDSTQRNLFQKPDPNSGAGLDSDDYSVNASSPKLAKPESVDKIKSVFYDDCAEGNPGTLETTMNDVLEVSFEK